MASDSVPYSVVDVFSTTPYKGNPLAVVDDSAGQLTDTQMKLIARQFNLSETTFFSQPTLADATYRLRSFLPDGKEVFGAGHNILGAWWLLAHDGRLDLSRPEGNGTAKGVDEFIFYQELGTQVTPVKILRQKTGSKVSLSVSLRQAPPGLHAQHPDVDALAASIGLDPEDIGIALNSQEHHGLSVLTPQVMSTSTTRHLIVPISSAAALDKVAIQRDNLLEQLSLVDKAAYGIYLFTPVGDPGAITKYRARFFSPGMPGEDPATGSAAGPLSAYLHHRGHLQLVNKTASIEVSQGQILGRECVMKVTLSSSGDVLNVDIKGSGVRVANGRLALPGASTTF